MTSTVPQEQTPPPAADGWVRPTVTPDGEPFFAGTAVGEIRVQYCGNCRRPRFPPRPFCPVCRSEAFEWRAVPPVGTVWSFVIAHPPVLPAYEALTPMPVLVVELDAEPSVRLAGRLTTHDGDPVHGQPEGLVAGAAVRAVLVGDGSEPVVPTWALFDPAGPDAAPEDPQH